MPRILSIVALCFACSAVAGERLRVQSLAPSTQGKWNVARGAHPQHRSVVEKRAKKPARTTALAVR